MGTRLLLGVDIGTQSAKGVLVTLDGRIVAAARHAHRPAQPRPGHFEQDADDVWWRSFLEVCRRLFTDDELDPHAVAAVGVSGIGPCLVPTDADGRPLRPAILYGIDTRATAETAWLTEQYGEQAGRVSAAAADQTGLPVGTPVSAGTGDAAAEAFGVGVRRPGDLMITYGSTTVLLQVVSELPLHTPLWGMAYVKPGEAAVVGGMATSGIVARWLRDLVGGTGVDHAELSRAAAAVPAGSRGLVALPYFAGERTPLHDPQARGMIAGLSLAHGRAELYRAILEGTAFGIRHNIEAMVDHGMAPRRVVAVGGGTEDDLWPQITSAVTGLPQHVAHPGVGAAYGDTILAGLAAGVVDPDVDGWHKPVRTIEPAADDADVYRRLYPVYRSLYEATVEQLHVLAGAQEETRPSPR